MSLDNIQLSPIVIQQLFTNSLIELKNKNTELETQSLFEINLLGKNLKKIVILVSYPDIAYLPDEELNFLMGILSACNLSMDDVGIANVLNNPTIDYQILSKDLQTDRVLLFAVGTDAIKLPLAFPHYQIQQYQSQTYLAAPSLTLLQNNKPEKTKLWFSLKQLFAIS